MYNTGWRFVPKMMVFGSTETIGKDGWIEGANAMTDRVIEMGDPMWINMGIDVLVDVVKPEKNPDMFEYLSNIGYSSIEEATDVALAGLAEFRSLNARLDGIVKWPTGVTIRGA